MQRLEADDRGSGAGDDRAGALGTGRSVGMEPRRTSRLFHLRSITTPDKL